MALVTIDDRVFPDLSELAALSHGAGGTADFMTRVAPLMLGGIGGDGVAYFEFDTAARRADVVVMLGMDRPAGFDAIVTRHGADDPWFLEVARTRDDRPRPWSSYLSPTQLRRNPLYAELYRPMHARHVIHADLPATGGLTRTIAVARHQKDYSETETAAFTALASVLRGLITCILLSEHQPSIPTPTRDRPALVTPRQAEVLAHVAMGLTNQAIAHRLDISPRTVAKHVSAALASTGTSNRTAAAITLLRASDAD